MSKKIAFITGASRGIGAESAAALAKQGYDVAVVARTLAEGEGHDHIGDSSPLPGSLEATAAVVKTLGREALCLRGDILDEDSMIAAVEKTLDHFGQIDFLFNNAVYQGVGNQETLMEVSKQQIQAVYQGNIFTPLAIIKAALPSMEHRKSGTIINMLSATAFLDPPATAAKGGWGFVYASSKAAFGRMAGALRVEHTDAGLRFFNLEPGTVITEVMKAAGIDKEILKFFRPCTPATIGAVAAWLADNEPKEEWKPLDVLRGPAIAKELGLLKVPSLLEP